MIAYLSGKVILIQEGYIIIEVSGVGYRVFIGDDVVVKAGNDIKLFVHNHIKEDTNDLYGFVSFDALKLFEKLITVSGVGPKVGMLIMSIDKPEAIISAIVEENVVFFQSVSGIGKKVAAKIILELKPKVSGLKSDSVIGRLDDAENLIEALSSLGFKSSEVSIAISRLPNEIKSFEDRVKWCIKNIRK